MDVPLPLTLVVSEPQLGEVAQALAALLAPGDCVALSGDIGAGKTTLARALIRAFIGNAALEVPSPTFALRQDYAGARGPIAHFDLYRISDPRELDEIGFEDAQVQSVLLVEWPERAGAALPSRHLEIAMQDAGDAGTRRVTISDHGGHARHLAGLQRAQ